MKTYTHGQANPHSPNTVILGTTGGLSHHMQWENLRPSIIIPAHLQAYFFQMNAFIRRRNRPYNQDDGKMENCIAPSHQWFLFLLIPAAGLLLLFLFTRTVGGKKLVSQKVMPGAPFDINCILKGKKKYSILLQLSVDYSGEDIAEDEWGLVCFLKVSFNGELLSDQRIGIGRPTGETVDRITGGYYMVRDSRFGSRYSHSSTVVLAVLKTGGEKSLVALQGTIVPDPNTVPKNLVISIT